MNSYKFREPWLAASLSFVLPGLGMLFIRKIFPGVIGIMLFTGFIIFFFVLLSHPAGTIYHLAYILTGLILLCILFAYFSLSIAKKANSPSDESQRIKMKEPWFAQFLNIILPGLGLLYYKNAIGWIIATIAILVVFFLDDKIMLLPAWAIAFFIASRITHYVSGRYREINRKDITILNLSVILVFFTLSYSINLVFNNFIYIVYSDSDSLNGNIRKGDYILVEINSTDSLQTGDIVFFYEFHEDSLRSYFLRVFASPGDTLIPSPEGIYINGKLKTDSLGTDYEKMAQQVDSNGVIPLFGYFLLSDNFENGIDSRDFGQVSRYKIIGKPYKIIYPSKRTIGINEKEGIESIKGIYYSGNHNQ